jgi:primosomal protein N'
MDNSVKYKDILNSYTSEPVVYECLLCGHEQPINDMCESCGSYVLEEMNLKSDDDIN